MNLYRNFFQFFIILLSLFTWPVVRAANHASLLTVYQDAVANDPQYLADRLSLEATQQTIPIARADLLPQVALTGEFSETDRQSRIDGRDKYNSSQYGINIHQAIFNFDALYRLRHAKADVRAAAARFSYQAQNLIYRVIQSYLAVLRTQALMNYTLRQVRFAKSFCKMADEKRQVRFATVTDASQAKLQLALMRSRLATAKMNYDNALDDLSVVTTRHYQGLQKIKADQYTKSLDKQSLTIWLSLARKQNLDLQAAKLTVNAARNAIEIPKTGFLPNLNAYVRYADQNSLDTNFGVKRVDDIRSVNTGLSASWQLIQGGKSISAIKQARKTYQRAIALANLTYLHVMAQTRKAVTNLNLGKRALDEASVALSTGSKGLQYTRDGFKAGVETMFDLLQAQNRLFTAQQTYIDTYYRYILNAVLLKQAIGTLSPKDILALSSYSKRG